MNNTDDLLKGYFDDLLQPEALSTRPEPKAVPDIQEKSPRELPQKSTAPTVPPAVVMQEELGDIEHVVEAALAEPEPRDEKKAQLQKLLHSARLQVDTVASPSAEIKSKEREVPVELEPAIDLDVESSITEFTDIRVLQAFLEWNSNGRPEWAQKEFDALLFTVSGLTLAVPLISLGQIQPLTDELTPLFGQADWFMGLQPTPSGKVRTVNTAKFVMPERYDENFIKTAKYVVSINGVPWGLAVDSVKQPITLEPDDVKWRSARTQRPWLAGTVKKEMCALLDIPAIGQMLVDGDRNAS